MKVQSGGSGAPSLRRRSALLAVFIAAVVAACGLYARERGHPASSPSAPSAHDESLHDMQPRPPTKRRSASIRVVEEQVPSDKLTTCTEKFTMDQVMEHGSSDDCWVVIHDKVIDVTSFIPKHPGGPARFQDEEGMLLCGSDMTRRFMAQHGALASLLTKAAAYAADIKILGELSEKPLPPSSLSGGPESYDFTATVKQPHPGSGQEFKTLVYIELKGAWDGASGFVNIKDEEEIHLWCSKRPTLSAAEYCECSDNSLEEGEACPKYVLKREPGPVLPGEDCWQNIFAMRDTGNHLAMTDLLACGDTGWMPLWNSGKMSIVPGVGRRDQKRSHFLVKDAAAKGVSVQLEQSTRNGWLGKSIFAYNNLYCKPDEVPCPPDPTLELEPTVDGISFAQAAAGPDALMVSQAIAQTGTFNHLSGVQDVSGVAEGGGFDYIRPFNRRMGARDMAHNFGYYDDETRQQTVKLREKTDEELWAEATTNPGLNDLLLKEQQLFESLGVLKEQLQDLKQQLKDKQVCGGAFPDIKEWADSSSSAEIGMQLYAVAVLLANGVYPKVYQVQQKRFDTHANQGPGLKNLLADLKTGIFTFVKAAEACGFFDKILVSTFTDFGRRLEENSRQGTDHGWGAYNMVFGTNLKDRIYGYNFDKNSKALGDIIPRHKDCYDVSKKTNGNLLLTYDIVTYNACLLNALALPALPRLGTCPPQLRFRTGLNTIPMYYEEEYYGAVKNSGDKSETQERDPVLPGDDGTTHLHTPLSRTEILHFARRVGYSTKSLGLDTYTMPGLGGRPAAQSELTLQQAISMVLSEENIASGQSPPRPVYFDFIARRRYWTLWTEEKRKKQNNWNIIQTLPYPRYDTLERRLKRFEIEKYFDLTSLTVNVNKPESPWYNLYDSAVDGAWETALAAGELNFIELNSEYKNNDDWNPAEILNDLKRSASEFYMPIAIHGGTGRSIAIKDLKKMKKQGNIDWYQTVMMVTDVKSITKVTTEDVIDDFTCECSNPDDLATCFNPRDKWDPGAVPCNPTCDFNELFVIDRSAKTAMLRDTRSPGSKRQARQQQVGWWVLQECVNLQGSGMYGKMPREKGRNRFESGRTIGEGLQDALYKRFFDDFTNPAYGLRARMTWFFLNMYAVPASANDWLLMSKMYDTIWRGALGNYRLLSRAMFKDGALRKSLDQLQEAPCDQAPIENFAREWFERFTVGLNGHNEGDVKKLSKALMNCKDSKETFNEDLVRPGVIFQDPEEPVWTATEAEEIAVVDRIIDYSHKPGEPPMAAQFLCGNLYKEFAIFPEVPETDALASSIGFAPEVVDCAAHLYDHNYDIKFALEYILQDKVFFREGLGKKKRWPLAVILGHLTDFTMKHSDRVDKMVQITNSVGMRPFEPQDVSGFSLENVWTLDRLKKMHDFLLSWVLPAVVHSGTSVNLNRLTKSSFSSRQTFLDQAAPYALSGADFGKFGFNTQICGPDFFIDRVGSQGDNVVDVERLFEMNWATRWRLWKKSVEYTITNVCQFVS